MVTQHKKNILWLIGCEYLLFKKHEKSLYNCFAIVEADF